MSHRVLGIQQGEQMAMFYTAGEIRKRWNMNPGDKEGFRTQREEWANKQQEAEASGMAEHIREHGVHAPVLLGPKHVFDGHHRMASALPDQIVPVVHTIGPDDVGSSSPRTKVGGKILPESWHVKGWFDSP